MGQIFKTLLKNKQTKKLYDLYDYMLFNVEKTC